MIFRDIAPCQALHPYIRSFRLVNLYGPLADLNTPYPTRLEQALVFFARGYINCHDSINNTTEKIARNALFGQQVSRLDFYPTKDPDFLMLMVVFQPTGLNRLFGIPASDITREFCDAESVLNLELRSLNDLIANAKDYGTILTQVESFFLKQTLKIKTRSHPIDQISKLMSIHPNGFSLDYLADQACLSPRQFERKFKERIGIGPKLFSRINRFFSTLQYKEINPDLDWLTIAIRFGYTDYNHLVKDFKEFANVTPNLIIKEHTQSPELVIKNPLSLF